MSRVTQSAGAGVPPLPLVVTPRLPSTETMRRRTAMLRQIFELDPLVCPRCAAPMRIVAFITQAAVIDQILTHLRTRAAAGTRLSDLSRPSTGTDVDSRSRAPRPNAP